MNLTIVTQIRLFGDALAACLRQYDDIVLAGILADLGLAQSLFADGVVDVVLVDVTQGVDLDEIRSTAIRHPQVALVALGLLDQRQDIIRCGRAGFIGYVDRDASIRQLGQALHDAHAGRLTCSAEVSGGLLRALFHRDAEPEPSPSVESLTLREGQVLQLIGDGLSNKEIATELSISLATVKHYVHHVLRKLQVCRRAQAMRRVRQAPWLAASPPLSREGKQIR